MNTDLQYELAREILELLRRLNRKLVCAESCTSGLVVATLGGIPGASNHLCGSAVVYRSEAKIAWLGVSEAVLSDPQQGDVCAETALQMARGVLMQTPIASVAVSVTGHLGPGSPPELDGVVYIGWAERETHSSQKIQVRAHRIDLQEPTPVNASDMTRRVARQKESAREVLLVIREALLQIDSRSSSH